MNKEENGTDVVVTSALWHMEGAIDHAIAKVKSGNFSSEEYHNWTMMAKGGASLAPYSVSYTHLTLPTTPYV